jgi:hypothetical protein
MNAAHYLLPSGQNALSGFTLGPRNLGRILIQLKGDGAICMGGETSARLISPAYAHTSSAGNELAKWL